MTDKGKEILGGKCILAFRASMGQASSYIASVPLLWVAQRVKFAGEMPVFANRVDSTSKKIKVDDYTIDHIQQRRPDWRRRLPMTVYLAAWEKHKFPPLLVVGHQKWADNPQAKEWGDGIKACRESVAATCLRDNLYQLDDSATTFYALDGQHRLMAIQGLQTLMDKGWLPALDQDAKPQGKRGVSFQDVAQAVRRQGGEELSDAAVLAKLRRIMSEEIGIEIIPAVSKNETISEAGFRLRSIFVDVNENAKKPTKGESILLDERNGFRVVARDAMVGHTLLKTRVNIKVKNISENSSDYTALETLVQIATAYLGRKKEFAEWKKPLIPHDKSSGFVRPTGYGDIGEGLVELLDYFTELKRLPSHDRMVRENLPASVFRGEADHILFRPVAQMAFAEASAILENEHRIPLSDAVSKLIRQEQCGQLKLRKPETPWYGVIWDPVRSKMRATAGAQKLCAQLFVYLLGGRIEPKDLEKLRKQFAKSRQTTDDETKATNLKGESVSMEDITLPTPWR